MKQISRWACFGFLSFFIIVLLFSCGGESGDSEDGDGEDEGDGEPSSEWAFTEDNVDLGISGVSTEAILLGNGSVRLYVTGMGMQTYTATDGLHFTSEGSAAPPQGSDPTVIPLQDGSYRMYYVGGVSGTREIRTATSPDGLTWTDEAGTGIENTSGNQAWGVPDTIVMPDGSVRIYWVDMPESGDGYEVIRSAVSTDGTSFTVEDGSRTEDGYVDPYVVFAEEGNWLALFSTTPAEPRLPQQIYIGTSTDGLTWTIETDPIISVEGGNALDPTAVSLGDGSYRVYYSATPTEDPFSDFYLRSGILAPASP